MRSLLHLLMTMDIISILAAREIQQLLLRQPQQGQCNNCTMTSNACSYDDPNSLHAMVSQHKIENVCWGDVLVSMDKSRATVDLLQAKHLDPRTGLDERHHAMAMTRDRNQCYSKPALVERLRYMKDTDRWNGRPDMAKFLNVYVVNWPRGLDVKEIKDALLMMQPPCLLRGLPKETTKVEVPGNGGTYLLTCEDEFSLLSMIMNLHHQLCIFPRNQKGCHTNAKFNVLANWRPAANQEDGEQELMGARIEAWYQFSCFAYAMLRDKSGNNPFRLWDFEYGFDHGSWPGHAGPFMTGRWPSDDAVFPERQEWSVAEWDQWRRQQGLAQQQATVVAEALERDRERLQMEARLAELRLRHNAELLEAAQGKAKPFPGQEQGQGQGWRDNFVGRGGAVQPNPKPPPPPPAPPPPTAPAPVHATPLQAFAPGIAPAMREPGRPGPGHVPNDGLRIHVQGSPYIPNVAGAGTSIKRSSSKIPPRKAPPPAKPTLPPQPSYMPAPPTPRAGKSWLESAGDQPQPNRSDMSMASTSDLVQPQAKGLGINTACYVPMAPASSSEFLAPALDPVQPQGHSITTQGAFIGLAPCTPNCMASTSSTPKAVVIRAPPPHLLQPLPFRPDTPLASPMRVRVVPPMPHMPMVQLVHPNIPAHFGDEDPDQDSGTESLNPGLHRQLSQVSLGGVEVVPPLLPPAGDVAGGPATNGNATPPPPVAGAPHSEGDATPPVPAPPTPRTWARSRPWVLPVPSTPSAEDGSWE